MKHSKENKKYLIFSIDDKAYAVPVLSLHGVVANPNVSKLTAAPKFVTGNFHIGHFNIPIIDLRLLLQKPDPTSPDKTCAIIVRVRFKEDDKLVGFIVDTVSGVNNIPEYKIGKLPSMGENEFISRVTNIQEQMIFFLDLNKIINEDNLIYFLNDFWSIEADVKNESLNEAKT